MFYRVEANMKFIPESQQEAVPEITVTREGTSVFSRIKYPEYKRTAEDEEEYEEDDREDL